MRWKRFLNGYVAVRLRGENLEVLLNEALGHDLELWDIARSKGRTAQVVVPLYHLWPFIRLARNMRCQLTVERRGGLPFWLGRLKRRKGLLVGAALFFALAYLGTSFLWSYEITGNERISEEKIVAILKGYGVVPGVSLHSLDFEALQSRFLIDHDDEFSWVAFGRKGTQLEVRVEERAAPLAGDTRPAHLVAKRDGVVKQVLVMRGTAMVQKNETVQKGQTLIAGIAYQEKQKQPDGTYLPVGEPEIIRAKGVIQGETTYEATAICPLREEQLRETGEMAQSIILRAGERVWRLKGEAESGFALFRTERYTKNLLSGQNYKSALQWIVTTYLEQEVFVQEYTLSQAYAEATERARLKLRQQLGSEKAVLREEVVVEESPDAEIVQVRVRQTVTENLAIPQLIAN